ncbi:hypothetical protein ACFPOI_34750 [Nonomuraea angiospora]|uniref:Ribbon-helix-helix protein CopG domain-containing protein n=1 Tax=Nonomuraea angiospora TaxID=46172 RepID=A0ABR9M843_9ACTN|nr:hypothetical protein [Nonomuraea angiospora]MBE1589074.1 hypothetical protein [Nonomuraea angiospora]MDX3107161.1 hypothetical protein [Nonomuraea angiospora]
MAIPIPSRRNSADNDKAPDTPAPPSWPMSAPRLSAEPKTQSGETASIIVNLDKATLDAVHQKARSDGRMISDVIRAAVEREVGNMTHATILIQRWNLQCDDLDRAADALKVDRISDDVMLRLGLHRNQED